MRYAICDSAANREERLLDLLMTRMAAGPKGTALLHPYRVWIRHWHAAEVERHRQRPPTRQLRIRQLAVLRAARMEVSQVGSEVLE